MTDGLNFIWRSFNSNMIIALNCYYLVKKVNLLVLTVMLSSLIGALVIIMGLYCVLWGKRADGQLEGASEDGREEFSANKTLEISINDGPVMNRISSEKN